MRLIDADKWYAFHTSEIEDLNPYDHYDTGFSDGMDATELWIERQPTIDPVHAAGGCYCRECKYRTWFCPGYGCGNEKAPWFFPDSDVAVFTKPDDFCSYGEKEDNNEGTAI